jgi:hypothetical protein
MNVQQSPHAADIEHQLDEIDQAVANIDHGTREVYSASIYGGPQRDGIISVAQAVADDLCKRCREAREALERIERRALASVARAKGIMNEHVTTCEKLDVEVHRIESLIADLNEQSHDA